MMDAKHNIKFLIGIFAFGLLSQAALADTAEEMARANNFYNRQQIVDAVNIFKKLAEENHVPAQARLGEILDYTEADEDAVGWFIMAAAQGDANAAYGLARMYFSGEGIKKDVDQAAFWFKYAAEKDNLNAIKVLEAAYRKGPISGFNLPLDLKQAQIWEAKKLPLEAAQKKLEDEEIAAFKKKAEEERAARRKADEEFAKMIEQGQKK